MDSSDTFHVLVRVALIRREHSTTSDSAFRDASGQAGLVNEVDIVSTLAWFEVKQASIEISSVLPIMADTVWNHGFSTVLNVGPATPIETADSISVSSTFHVASTLAFLPQTARSPTLADVMPGILPPVGVFTAPQAGPIIDMASLKRNFPGTVRTLPLPIIVGSVSEPRSAMRTIRWSDLHLDQSSGEEVGRMLTGEVMSCEDGWIQAPPSYAEACEDAPYEF